MLTFLAQQKIRIGMYAKIIKVKIQPLYKEIPIPVINMPASMIKVEILYPIACWKASVSSAKFDANSACF